MIVSATSFYRQMSERRKTYAECAVVDTVEEIMTILYPWHGWWWGRDEMDRLLVIE